MRATVQHFALRLSKFDFICRFHCEYQTNICTAPESPSFLYLPIFLFRSQPSPHWLMFGKHFSLYTFSRRRIRKKMQHLRDDKLIRKFNYRMLSVKKIVKLSLSSLAFLIWHTRNNVFVFSRLDVSELCDRQISINSLRVSSSRCINWFDVSIG